jgi:hypothetical protein
MLQAEFDYSRQRWQRSECVLISLQVLPSKKTWKITFSIRCPSIKQRQSYQTLPYVQVQQAIASFDFDENDFTKLLYFSPSVTCSFSTL